MQRKNGMSSLTFKLTRDCNLKFSLGVINGGYSDIEIIMTTILKLVVISRTMVAYSHHIQRICHLLKLKSLILIY
jgi:hypothetical protein